MNLSKNPAFLMIWNSFSDRPHFTSNALIEAKGYHFLSLCHHPVPGYINQFVDATYYRPHMSDGEVLNNLKLQFPNFSTEGGVPLSRLCPGLQREEHQHQSIRPGLPWQSPPTL